MRNLFLLDKDVIFLNHGSFGACPGILMKEYQKYQVELERQPVDFVVRKGPELLKESRTALGEFIGCLPENIVYVPNATTGLNIIANTIELSPGDEILSTDIEYGATERMWEIICQRKGAKFIKSTISQPIKDSKSFASEIIKNYSQNTKILFISHITSATAQLLPIEEIVIWAKSKNLTVIIDGAHAPGHIPLKLDNSNFDFYVGNCHKWLMSPKGAAFLYAKQEAQKLIKPYIISWGRNSGIVTDSEFIDEYTFQGTMDVASYITVKDAIKFREEYFTIERKEAIRDLLLYAQKGFYEILKTEPICPDLFENAMFYAHPLPADCNTKELKKELLEKYNIEIPLTEANGKNYIRISIHIYNTKEEVDKLMSALKTFF